MVSRSLFLALVSGVLAFSPEGESGPTNLTQHGREMSSPGCVNCCINHDCRLAFMMTSPGVCCGMHPATGAQSCCPFDASCVRCRSKWRCTRSKYITRTTKCQVCGDDRPSDCFYRQPVYHHSSGSSYSFMLMLLLIGFCAIGACAYQRQGGFYDEPVIVQQGAPQITGYTPNGQPIYAQPQVVMAQGGYGGGSVAGAAATGFVGGMLVGEALDAGHGGYGGYGGGYGGGGYGGEYGGGGGGFGGGDGGFDAD